MRVLLQANPEQPGYVMPCVHPVHGPCMVHVGTGSEREVQAALRRSGASPLYEGVQNPQGAVVLSEAAPALRLERACAAQCVMSRHTCPPVVETMGLCANA